MKKLIVSAVVLASLLGASVASAQSYYTSYGSSYSYGTACAGLTRDLSVGMRGSDVSTLQSFLVSRNYPGGGSWMVTGYFGRATQAAVQIFQQERGLPMTGIADAATRAAVCGAQNPVFPVNPVYPTYPTYPSYPTYPYTGGVTITSLSSTSAAQNSPVTIYGTGFDYNNNTVYVGSTPLANISSTNGTSLSFVVPSYMTGSVQIYVANSRGQSNAVTLSIVPYTYPCSSSYPYNTNCNTCAYPYTNCPSGQLSIQYLSPTSGAVGSSVTIYGTGFSSTNNTVRFGQGIIAGISSFDGRSLTFTVPSQLTGYASQTVMLATYNVSVQNSAGFTSNSIPFTVTSLGSAGAPVISNVSGPTSLNTGVTGTWTVQLYNTPQSYSNYVTLSVRWGDESVYGASISPAQTSYAQGSQTFTFAHAYMQPGTYTVTFTATNASGQSNVSTATVTVSGSSTGSVSLSSANPTSGVVGTQIMLTGSGFHPTSNTIRFGVGGTQHIPAYNGNTMYFTVPLYVSPCDVSTSGSVCAQYFQQVTPGTYQIYVTNAYGTSNVINFTVTQ